MDEEIDRLVVSVRADTAAFARDVSAMRAELDGPLATGVARAGRMIETALGRAIVSGKFGFEDLKRVALSAMAQIASASLRALFAPAAGSGGPALLGGLGSLVQGLLGAPGRAIGGPVNAGRPYMVGERGPELFVPSTTGRIESAGWRPRDVRIAISVQSPPVVAQRLLRQSSRQVAKAVRNALLADPR